MHKPLGIFAFTNLVREESEWQSVSESPSTGAYVGFLFACYSNPVKAAQSVAAGRSVCCSRAVRSPHRLHLVEQHVVGSVLQRQQLGNAAASSEREGGVKTRSCSALAVVDVTPTISPGVVFGAPGPAGDGRLVTVSPARFADIAVDPAAGPDRGACQDGIWRSAAGHRAAFSRSISRKIAWPAWSGDVTRKAFKSSGSSSRVTRKAPRPCRCLIRRILAAAKVC
jgi:hypothetical protein